MDPDYSELTGSLGQTKPSDTLALDKHAVISDYRMAYRSRQVSLIGRREVLTGKAKFGIFGDGKELPQMAMAKVFKPGDIRSGYYRDQTFGFATGILNVREFFAQLYAHTDVAFDPSSAGRQMNNHLSVRMLDDAGNWKDQTQLSNTAADVSCTAAQMPRLVGLGLASVLYRAHSSFTQAGKFSRLGNEIAFGTIGNASCAEGHFWETINALGVVKAPVILSIWDDEYGISVPNEYQVTKSNLSALLEGFQREHVGGQGIELFTVPGWDYLQLLEVYSQAEQLARNEHVPCVIHVVELTQPQGHSTSGSHERYKSEDRLAWERDHDCLEKFRQWILDQNWMDEPSLVQLEKEERLWVRKEKNAAWAAYRQPLLAELNELVSLSRNIAAQSAYNSEIKQVINQLRRVTDPVRKDLMEASNRILMMVSGEVRSKHVDQLKEWRKQLDERMKAAYDQYLLGESAHSPLLEKGTPIQVAEKPPMLNGFEILNRVFDHIFEERPEVVAFGEDVGHLGDVNQGFAGLQAKHGEHRIWDTGIRETTIVGQAIGLAMRGFRPIAEIQYLDYLLYGLQTLSDDLATLTYRTFRGQKAPVIIRTRGHRLEGIWHAGSPLGVIIHALRGIHVLVPRNMTQAAGFYQTLLDGDEPGLIIEVLNGYRLKEPLPDNLFDYRVPLGVPEVIREGEHITVVTYGACCRIAMEAARLLESMHISLEVIDVQSLLPFDRFHRIVDSLKKTNRIIFMDEDVPGGASAYMMQQVLEQQKGYLYLDAAPRTLSAKDHRTAYSSDGDYWSKPQPEHLVQLAVEIMNEFDPNTYPIYL